MSERTSIRILCVDDEPATLNILVRQLRPIFDVSTAPNPEAALKKIDAGETYQAIVSDYTMPGANGVELLSMLRTMAPGSARVLLTGETDFDIAVDAVNRGKIHQFLSKPWKKEKLIHAIQDAIKRVAEESGDHNELIFRDDLTSLYNRRYFDSVLVNEHNRCARHGSTYAIAFVDLDGLKAVNTAHGHLVGSEVIKQAAHCIASASRTSDLKFRFGGDEFVTLLIESNATKAKKYAERVLEALNAHQFRAGNDPLNISASIGVAAFPEHGKTEREVLEHADQAMYVAKNTGKGRAVVFGKKC